MTIDELILMLRAIIVANFIVKFQPIQWLLELIKGGVIKWIAVLLTSCFKCCTFWTTLIYTGDFILACISFAAADIWTKINEKIWQKRLKL